MALSLVTYALSRNYTDQKAIDISKDAIEQAVAQANAYTDSVATQIEWHLKKVDVLPPIEEADAHTIYFVPANLVPQYDGYFEYLVMNGQWEAIGRTAVDLSNYFTKQETIDYVATYFNDHQFKIDERTINWEEETNTLSLKTVSEQEILDLF